MTDDSLSMGIDEILDRLEQLSYLAGDAMLFLLADKEVTQFVDNLTKLLIAV